MKDIKIAFLPGGAGNAVNAIKAYKKFDHVKTIALDTNKYSAGLKLADKGYIVKGFEDEEFLDELMTIIEREHIDILLPDLDESEMFLVSNLGALRSTGVNVIISPKNTIKVTSDKWQTWEALHNYINMPMSFILLNDLSYNFPLFIKPRISSGSKSVYKLTNVVDLVYHYYKMHRPIIQEYLPGKEYTVDCFVSKNEGLLFAVPRTRIQAKSGMATISQVRYNKYLMNVAETIAERLRFVGPFFFQAKEGSDGILKVTEIGARMSGGMILTDKAGAHLYENIIRLHKKLPMKTPVINYACTMTRYWEEYFFNEA